LLFQEFDKKLEHAEEKTKKTEALIKMKSSSKVFGLHGKKERDIKKI